MQLVNPSKSKYTYVYLSKILPVTKNECGYVCVPIYICNIYMCIKIDNLYSFSNIDVS